MPAIKVKATQAGWYGGEYRRPGSEFVLVDLKNSDGTVKTDQNGIALTAETFFADHKLRGGWMKKVEDQNKAALRAAQAREDLKALGKGDQTNSEEDTEEVPNAAGTELVKRPKRGTNAAVEPGSSAGGNQSSKEVI